MSRIYEKMTREPIYQPPAELSRVEFMNNNAHMMRAAPTPQEAAVMDEIKRRGIRGIKNQEQLFGRFIGDFCHRATKSVFEIDGRQHRHSEDGLSTDAKREFFLLSKGYTVNHYTNDLVDTDVGAVVDSIVATIKRKRALK